MAHLSRSKLRTVLLSIIIVVQLFVLVLLSLTGQQCALDCAVWDVYAQMHGMPLWKLWGLRDDEPYPPTCYTIGIDTPEVMVRKMQAMPEWPVYKIKLDASGGLALVRAPGCAGGAGTAHGIPGIHLKGNRSAASVRSS